LSNNSSDQTVSITVVLGKGELAALEAQNTGNGCNGVHAMFKLTSTFSTTNMHMFNADNKLVKYTNVVDIVDDYFDVRLQMYKTRKAHLLRIYRAESRVFVNKVRYIEAVLDGTIDLRGKTAMGVREMLSAAKFDSASSLDGLNESNDLNSLNDLNSSNEKGSNITNKDDYEYLIGMKMSSVTSERVASLRDDNARLNAKIQTTESTSATQMWQSEIDTLRTAYTTYVGARQAEIEKDIADSLMSPTSSKMKLTKPKANLKPKPKPKPK
jgi:DNA topoisomerase II